MWCVFFQAFLLIWPIIDRLLCQIRNGSTADSPLIDRLCGGTIPDPIFPQSNHLYLRFKSDFSMARDGFEATWTSSPHGENVWLLTWFDSSFLLILVGKFSGSGQTTTILSKDNHHKSPDMEYTFPVCHFPSTIVIQYWINIILLIWSSLRYQLNNQLLSVPVIITNTEF